jgi:hypothetical protein
VINVLITLILGPSFILVFHLVNQPIEQFHFLQYGVLGILVFWALSGRPYTLQFYLLAITLFLVVGYLDEIIQGFVPDRIYDLEDTYVDVLSGAMGFLLSRIMDLTAPLPLHPTSRSKHGVSTEPTPLIDLHIYWKDLLYLIPLVTILLTDHVFVTWIKPEEVIGRWTCTGSPPCTLTLKKGTEALFTTPLASCAATYGFEGNLLDGFRIRLATSPDLEEAHQDCGILKAPVFHILKTTEGLSLLHKELGTLRRVI